MLFLLFSNFLHTSHREFISFVNTCVTHGNIYQRKMRHLSYVCLNDRLW